MNDFQVRDFATAIGFSAVAYTLFNTLVTFGSGKPLAEWINPHRRYLISLGAVLLAGAYTLLYQASLRYATPMGDLLETLFREERASPYVIGAVSFSLFGGTVWALYFWCRWLYPRDPKTFSPGSTDLRAEYRRAMRHYARWSGHLDYVALYVLEGDRREKAAEYALPARRVFARMARVDAMRAPAAADRAAVSAAVAAQVARWDDLAARSFDQWDGFDGLIGPARHGDNVLILFDAQFGGVFVELLQQFKGAEGGKVRVFLFAVCLDQYGLDSAAATQQYALLSTAIRHIRTGGGKAGA